MIKIVYKKYIKRNGKVFGPYYYESYRENGKVKTRFISGPRPEDNKNWGKVILFIFIGLVLLGGIGYYSYEGIVGGDLPGGKIIDIVSANYLDSQGEFIEDIFSLVNRRDNNSYLVNQSGIIVIEFEKNLSKKNDISFYGGSELGGRVEVYPRSLDNEMVMSFEVSEDGLYRKYLKDLSFDESKFYLKTTGSIKFDYIFDPEFSPSGCCASPPNYEWNNTYVSGTQGHSIDYHNGSIYAGGVGSTTQWVIQKINSTNGTQISDVSLDFAEDANFGDLTTDNLGNVYVVGNYHVAALGEHFYAKKYNSSLDVDWIYDPGIMGLIYNLTSIEADNYSDGVYIGGTANISRNDLDAYISRLNGTTGAQVWNYSYDSNNANESIEGITIDNKGFIYFVGNNDSDPFIVKVNATNGAHVWNESFDTGGEDSFSEVTYYGDSLYVVGNALDDSLLRKFNATNGSQIWATNFDGDVGLTTSAKDVYVDIHGDPYVTGDHSNFWYITKYLANSTLEWNLTYGQGISRGITMDDSNNIYLTGSLNVIFHTVRFNATDSVNPDVSIIFPLINNTNHSNVNLDINYTRSDLNLASCWYSNDTFTKNITLASCTNLTTIIWSEGNHNVTIYVNDTDGNNNQSSISFFIDTINPDINITFPINNTNSSDTGLDINFTRNNTNLDTCWYGNDTFTKNITLASCTNLTTITWSAGNHNVTIYVNDTYGNNNQSSVSFNISVDGGSGDGGGSGGGGGGGDSESGDSISDGESSEDSISDGEGSEDSGSDVGDEDFQLEEVNPPENFVCENWKACSLDYGLDLLQSSTIKLSEEQIRVCNDGSIETIQRRACRSEQPNIIKKVNNLLFGKGVDILNSKEDPLVNLVLYSVVEDGILIDKLDFNFPITGRFIDDSVGNVPDQGFFSTILHFLKVFLDMVTH